MPEASSLLKRFRCISTDDVTGPSVYSGRVHPARPPSLRAFLLIDALGAILSTVLFGVVLPKYQATFGMPLGALQGLALVAAVYAFHSLGCRLLADQKLEGHLLRVAIGNAGYCVLIATLAYRFREELTPWGWLYFAGDLLIVGTLTVVQMRAVKAARQP